MLNRSLAQALIGALGAAVIACEGGTGDAVRQCPPAVMEDTSAAAPVWHMRKLTARELGRTLKAVIGVVPDSLAYLPPDPVDIGANPPPPSSFEVDLYRQIATEAAAAGADKLLTRWSCTDPDCLREAIAKLVERAYRGPVEQSELHAYIDVLYSERESLAGVQRVLEELLQSPRFLYVIERGIAREHDETTRTLTGPELAARLSYFLWSEPPDTELADAARTGQLSKRSVLEAQTRRLLAAPEAADTLGLALRTWAAPELDVIAKSGDVYPEFDPVLRRSMIQQFEHFAAMALADDQGLLELLTTHRVPIDASLAELLDIDAGHFGKNAAGHNVWKTVDLGAQRFGLLTLPGVLTSNARADDSSPILRGLFIRKNLLCQPIPPPPPNVVTMLPSGGPNDFRERFAEHSKNPQCAFCHAMMDPLGYPLEIFDGIGRLRTSLKGIETDGDLQGVETPAHFADLGEMVDVLVHTPEVSRCWAQQWTQRALGPGGAQASALIDRLAASVESDASLADVIVTIATSPEFARVQRPTAP